MNEAAGKPVKEGRVAHFKPLAARQPPDQRLAPALWLPRHARVEGAKVARVVLYSEIMYLAKGTLEGPGSQHQEELAALRTELSVHPAAQDALSAAGLSSQDVVATTVAPGGILLF